MLGPHPRDPEPPPPFPALWDAAADLLLQRAALGVRLRRDRPPDPLAGLKVDEADLRALLEELPGLDDPGTTGDEALAYEDALPLVAARAELAAALTGGGALARLAAFARLDPLEAEVLALLCAVEADPRRQRLVGYLNDDVTQRRLTLWTLGELLGPSDDLARAVGPGGGLRRAALLGAPGDAPWSSAPIAVPAAVLWWLHGGRALEPGLPPGAELVDAPVVGDADLVVAAGPDRRRRREAALAAVAGSSAVVSDLPADAGQWDAIVRQATLSGSAVVVEVDGALPTAARDRIEQADHLSWAVTSPVELPVSGLFRRPWVEAVVAPPEATADEWAALLPDHDRAAPEAGPAYRLSADQLHDVARAARATGGSLRQAVRRLAAGHIDATATRIQPSRTWDDLVLDDERMGHVREIAIRHRRRDLVYDTWGFSPHPSTGVVALFAGPSGTGKTLAAEIVAGDLGVDLYKVDLANLVSKYIGDTEKNLSRVFDAAEASRVVLFFDEADALLGKRSAVSDAHDRYANIEVAYLLQRLEAYEGIVVLATNLASNLDPAFLRRLHVVVEFPVPGPAERRRIWARSIPPGAPVDADVDLDRLADQVDVTGGTIRGAATRAAFLAAEAGTPITMELALTALRRELAKVGRLANASEWRRLFDPAQP